MKENSQISFSCVVDMDLDLEPQTQKEKSEEPLKKKKRKVVKKKKIEKETATEIPDEVDEIVHVENKCGRKPI